LISPLVGFSSEEIIFNIVVFPHPLSPTRVIISPVLTSRENSSNMSVIMCIMLGMTGSMVPVLIAIVIAQTVATVIIPLNEERTRKLLISYLQNHERAMSVNYKNNNKSRKEIYDQNPIIDLTDKDDKKKTRSSAKPKTTTKKSTKNQKIRSSNNEGN